MCLVTVVIWIIQQTVGTRDPLIITYPTDGIFCEAEIHLKYSVEDRYKFYEDYLSQLNKKCSQNEIICAYEKTLLRTMVLRITLVRN